MKKKVLITGVCGFIGSHTAKVFKEAGWTVVGIDRTLTIPESSQYIDIMFYSDFADISPIILMSEGIETIIHCAGTSLVGPSIADPGEYYNNNTAKTNKFLDALAKNNFKGSFIFSSSAATYGNDCAVPIKETAEGTPVSPYGMSKKMSEYVIRDHCTAHGIRGIALRYFNACGCDPDGQLGHVNDDTHIIPSILRAYAQGQTFMLNGNDFNTPDGTCVRDYLHVTDIARAHLAAAELAKTFDTGKFKAYNLGTNTGYSNLEIIKACEQAVNDTIKYQIGPKRAGDPDALIADSGLFQQETDWAPENSKINIIASTAYTWSCRSLTKEGKEDSYEMA